jgi:ADP-heptose:LPS heptosyltransferase
LPYPEQGTETDRLLELMTFLGLPEVDRALEFPLTEVEYQSGLRLLEAHSLVPGQYVCLHPGASVESRRWSTAGFSQVARQLASQGHRIVLTGTAAEGELTRSIAAALNQPGSPQPIDLAGRTSLGSLAVLLRHAALLICNDTGISHLGAALKVPSVVVFSDSEVQRWAPGDRTRHRIVDSRQTSPALPGTVSQAVPERVLMQALDLLRSPPRSSSLVEVCHA